MNNKYNKEDEMHVAP